MADEAAPKKKRGRKKGSAKRGRKKGARKGLAKRGTARRGSGKLVARVARLEGGQRRLEARVDNHSKQLRHHHSFLNAIVNSVRRAVGQKPLKDPVSQSAQKALPGSAFKRLGSGR